MSVSLPHRVRLPLTLSPNLPAKCCASPSKRQGMEMSCRPVSNNNNSSNNRVHNKHHPMHSLRETPAIQYRIYPIINCGQTACDKWLSFGPILTENKHQPTQVTRSARSQISRLTLHIKLRGPRVGLVLHDDTRGLCRGRLVRQRGRKRERDVCGPLGNHKTRWPLGSLYYYYYTDNPQQQPPRPDVDSRSTCTIYLFQLTIRVLGKTLHTNWPCLWSKIGDNLQEFRNK